MSGESSPSRARPAKGGIRDWRVVAVAVVVVLGLAVLLARTLGESGRYADLVRAEPDGIVQNVQLASFAEAEAKPLFAKHCAACHGPDMKGDRYRGVPDLTDQDWLYGTGRIAEIEKTILYGIRSGSNRGWNLADMPAFGEQNPYRRYKVTPLSPGDIRDVIAYMRVLEGQKAADPAAAVRGQKVFSDTGQCYDCHANDGAGDSAIGAPNLVDKVWLYGDGSDESVFKSIAHGHQGIMPAWSGRLTPGEIRALAVYIYEASHPKAPGQTQAAAALPSQEWPNREGKPS